jgi:xanthosine utilization system XapX-like protein
MRRLSLKRARAAILRAFAEIAFIIFLFYANLLMGEFTLANGAHKTLRMALRDLATPRIALIGLLAALVGYPFFEFLRSKTAEEP